jgi:hypothetical protein
LSIAESGVFLPGNAKALVKFLGKHETYQVLGSQNRGRFKIFQLRDTINSIRIANDENTALITLKDGRNQNGNFLTEALFCRNLRGSLIFQNR